MGKQSHEGKIEAEGNVLTHKSCDRMNGLKMNQRRQINEQAMYHMNKRTSSTIEKTETSKLDHLLVKWYKLAL